MRNDTKDLPGHSTESDQVSERQIIKDKEEIVDLLNTQLAPKFRVNPLGPHQLVFPNAFG